ncbi:anillin-like [Argiope bruennichi]|uniref:anillin-like n=1 Tax=Argiope bruennichi TaxID=94029 RepID=UPI0024949B76|nr:anillin-like [Argiope bruennichi]
MDLDDSFTDKLLKRTKARKDYLKGKMTDSPNRKKRTALVEEQQIPNEDDKGHKESPKRLCVEQVAADNEVKEDDPMEEVKENNYFKECEPMEEEEEAPLKARGLAALRKKNTMQDDPNDKKVFKDELMGKPPTYVFSTNSTELCSTRKNRLASLAADINGWEDNLKRTAVPATTTAKGAQTKSGNHININKIGEQKTCNSVKEMGKEAEKQKPAFNKEKILQPSFKAKEVEDTLNRSFEPSNLPLSARKALFEQAAHGNKTQSEQQTIEPKLSVAQRAAMFENGPKNKFGSRSAYQKPAYASPDKPFTKVDRDSPVKSAATSSCKSPAKPSTALNGSPAKPVVLKGSPAELSSVLIGSPAKPFAALTGSPSKSLAAASGSPAKISFALNRNSPAKSGTTEGRATTPAKSSIPKPPAEPPMSPSQQQWVKSAGIEPDKKRPLSSLVNHWEKLSSSSSVTNSQSEEEVPPHALPARENVSYSSEEEQDEQVESDCEEELTESEHEEQHVQSEHEEPAASEDEESKTDSNFDEEESADDDPFTDTSSFNSKKFAAAAGIETETENEDRNSAPDRYSANSVSDGSSCYPSQSLSSSSCGTTDGEERAGHQPLSYTVSFYRKQKQDSRTPPLRTIVRREQVPPLTEEEQGRIIDIQEAIKRLQEEVVLQQNIIGQTSQLINVCCTKPEFSGSTEEVEAEKVLLTATQKRQACLNEIQRLKSHGAQGGVAEDGYGTLTIMNMELPLKRDFIAAQLEGKTSDIHYFLCLVRHGHQVIETQMVSTNDKIADGSLHFTNLIKLKNLPPDFSVVFEVFTLQTKKESMSHDKKYGIRRDHSKIRLTPKGKKGDGKLPAVSSPGGPHAVRSPSFRVVGYTRFTLQNCTKKCFTLDKIPFTSPLEGVLKVKLQLHAEHNVTERGFLTMFEDVSGFGAWHRRWCCLENHLLSYWKYPDEENKKDAMGSIDLRQCITKEVRVVSRDICARPHTFQLVEVRPRKKGDRDTLISQSHDTLTTTRRLLSADTREERERWCQRLNDALRYVRLWDPKALAPTQ